MTANQHFCLLRNNATRNTQWNILFPPLDWSSRTIFMERPLEWNARKCNKHKAGREIELCLWVQPAEIMWHLPAGWKPTLRSDFGTRNMKNFAPKLTSFIRHGWVYYVLYWSIYWWINVIFLHNDVKASFLSPCCAKTQRALCVSECVCFLLAECQPLDSRRAPRLAWLAPHSPPPPGLFNPGAVT